eukprot:TRINITY_DN8531_c0_g1_i2.p1 TRINITY_DN8531_c0_g1~~TRINITY_DN8531_c0_g1_i2.p1  ORF type:complete len:163 (-),score=44.04 TRINITY_DN8531_c0_g1_i2:119-607(-)
MLSPFDGVPPTSPGNRSVLVIGAADPHRDRMANALARTNVSVHATSSLPLPVNPERQRMDFVVVMIDLARISTFVEAKEILAKWIHPEYFSLGKVSLVLMQGDSLQSVDMRQIRELTEHYEIRSHFMTATEERETAEAIMRLVNLTSCTTNFLNPMFFANMQ